MDVAEEELEIGWLEEAGILELERLLEDEGTRLDELAQEAKSNKAIGKTAVFS